MRILLAEDEKELSKAVCAILSMRGYEPDPAYDGQEAFEKASAGAYDAYVFDIMMPRKDGLTLLRELRESGDLTPTLLLTAKAEVENRVEGLDAGADDYLTKPFAMKELVARIHSLTRRNTSYTPTEVKWADVSLNTENLELKSENTIRLAGKEAELMELFLRNPNKEISTDQLYDKLWKNDLEAEREVVWVYISFLRKKLSAINARVVISGEKDGSFKLMTERA